MKKILSFTSIIALLLCFQACTDLEEFQPNDSIPADGALNNRASAQALLNGAYDEFQDATLAFDGWVGLPQLFSDETVFTGTFPTRLEFGNYNVFPANTTMAAVFSDIYDAINVANSVIADVPGIESPSMTAEIANNMVAEASFLRALSYLHLTTLWGDVPLLTTPTRSDQLGEALEVANNSQADIYAQIITDLEFAEANLTGTSEFRASPTAATALLARVYLYQGNYPSALTKAVAALGGATFDLTQFPYLSDQIFSLNFTAIDGNSLAFFYGPAELGGRHSIEPSPKLMAAYEAGDARLDLSITNDPMVASVPFCIKYSDFGGASSGSGVDPILFIRHSEMCLIAAEAAAEAMDFATADTWINMVRARAGLGAVALDASNYVDLILQERFVELALEGSHRINDLRRRGKAESTLGADGYDACDKVWPIPQRELDRNRNITQNDCCNC